MDTAIVHERVLAEDEGMIVNFHNRKKARGSDVGKYTARCSVPTKLAERDIGRDGCNRLEQRGLHAFDGWVKF